MIASPSAAEVVKQATDGHEIYLFKFPQTSVKELILGHRISKKDQAERVGIARSKYTDSKVFKAALSERRYDLNIFFPVGPVIK